MLLVLFSPFSFPSLPFPLVSSFSYPFLCSYLLSKLSTLLFLLSSFFSPSHFIFSIFNFSPPIYFLLSLFICSVLPSLFSFVYQFCFLSSKPSPLGFSKKITLVIIVYIHREPTPSPLIQANLVALNLRGQSMKKILMVPLSI